MGLFGSKKTPEEILAEGRELYGDFNFAKALKVLDKASGTLDGEPDYLIALIYMYCHQDDSIISESRRTRAMKRQPGFGRSSIRSIRSQRRNSLRTAMRLIRRKSIKMPLAGGRRRMRGEAPMQACSWDCCTKTARS